MKKNDLLFYLAIVLAVWFTLTAWIWTYFICLFISYPFGLISLLIWHNLKKENEKRTQWIPRILTVGLVASFAILVVLLIWN